MCFTLKSMHELCPVLPLQQMSPLPEKASRGNGGLRGGQLVARELWTEEVNWVIPMEILNDPGPRGILVPGPHP